MLATYDNYELSKVILQLRALFGGSTGQQVIRLTQAYGRAMDEALPGFQDRPLVHRRSTGDE